MMTRRGSELWQILVYPAPLSTLRLETSGMRVTSTPSQGLARHSGSKDSNLSVSVSILLMFPSIYPCAWNLPFGTHHKVFFSEMLPNVVFSYMYPLNVIFQDTFFLIIFTIYHWVSLSNSSDMLPQICFRLNCFFKGLQLAGQLSFTRVRTSAEHL